MLLNAALFFTLGVVGTYVSLMRFSAGPWWAPVFWGIFTGGFCAAYFTAVIRRRKWLPAIIGLHVLLTLVSARWFQASDLPATAMGRHIAGDATAMLICAMAGYGLFFAFISLEGFQHIQIKTELALAHRLQQTLVPTLSLTGTHFEIFGKTIPSEKVGGDVVDAITNVDGVAAYVADISGHGIPAGVLMGMLKSMLRMGVSQHLHLSEMLSSVNRVLPSVKDPNMYATLAYMNLSTSGTGEYVIAGHLPILHYRSADHEVSQLKQASVPVGLLASAEFPTAHISFAAGDIFVLTTDGITEVSAEGEDDFGLDRIEYAVMQHAREPLETIFDAVITAVRAHGPQQDDQTLLLVRVL